MWGQGPGARTSPVPDLFLPLFQQVPHAGDQYLLIHACCLLATEINLSTPAALPRAGPYADKYGDLLIHSFCPGAACWPACQAACSGC